MKYSLYFWAEVVTLLISLFAYRKIKDTHLRLFPFFLGVIVLYEFGTIQNWFTINHSNLWASNIITIFEFLFYAFFLRSIIEDSQKKIRIKAGVVILTIMSIINITFIQGFFKFHSYTFLLSSVFIVFLICIYFWQLLNSDFFEISLLQYPNFWIATGLLFFYIGEFAFFAFFEYMAYKNDYSYLTLTKIVLNISNLILYTFLSIGLICQYRIRQ